MRVARFVVVLWFALFGYLFVGSTRLGWSSKGDQKENRNHFGGFPTKRHPLVFEHVLNVSTMPCACVYICMCTSIHLPNAYIYIYIHIYAAYSHAYTFILTNN